MNQEWWSEIGLFLDLMAFAMLSWDLVSSINGERTARDDIFRIERRAFNSRYAIFGPGNEKFGQEQDEFERRQQERRRKSDASIRKRQIVACVAIMIATIGFAMQLYGGWPV
ncbi:MULTISPECIES: hypothetical protein [Rhizobium/Agrobacterium group]|uniref:hypothetical protein n=1 Tax=Rhizobium/Agrobacterium group TaxID=227290 RepID=UPI000FDAFDBC|nr:MULTISPECIES: hypothetical protein [Rhizobium/Agrobacterium group]MBB4399727.1 hypothetical protein [Agrobacterium radiobacter]MBB5585882.1 hypothetical protein [Agrobacterium radiobacter]NTB97731.1 hypothetical protein [Agrobacterium tumefaciens]NTC47131.1 hypothetical protein [Agrobacterium tumefaciens]RVT80305.1 hypothetical protein EM858_04770 [Agrobacterium sp. CNPSo 2736]